jgi:hypothetical protein
MVSNSRLKGMGKKRAVAIGFLKAKPEKRPPNVRTRVKKRE